MTDQVRGRRPSTVTTRSTAGPGFAFEDMIAADLLSRFILDMPIYGIEVPGSSLLSQVKALGWSIDDLLCVGKGADGRTRRLAISCKSSLQVTANGLPSDYVAAAWTMWRDSERFDRAFDRMALATRGRHAGFDTLWHDIRSWCSGDPTLAFARIDASASHRRVFDAVRQPGRHSGEVPTPADVMGLINSIDVVPTDFQLTPSVSLAAARQRPFSGSSLT